MAENESFDFGCMAIGNVDNSSPPCDKICVGSQQGMLRIFNPSKPMYRIEDLVLEELLSAPILQVLIGQFVSSTELNALAILHPHSLVVYEVVQQGACIS